MRTRVADYPITKIIIHAATITGIAMLTFWTSDPFTGIDIVHAASIVAMLVCVTGNVGTKILITTVPVPIALLTFRTLTFIAGTIRIWILGPHST